MKLGGPLGEPRGADRPRSGAPPRGFAGLGLAVLALFAAGLPRTAAADVITLTSDPWCPFICEGEPDRPGYVVEIAERALGAAGHEVSFQFLPWPRAIAAVNSGAVTGLAGMGKADGPNFFLTKSLGHHRLGLAVRRGTDFHYAGTQSLETYRLGTVAGVQSWGSGLDEYIAANVTNPDRVDVTPGDDPYVTNVRKLLAGRVDVIVDNADVLEWLAIGLGVRDKIDIVVVSETDDILIGFSPAAPKGADYARAVDEGVATLRASGELAAIMAKYGLKDWQP